MSQPPAADPAGSLPPPDQMGSVPDAEMWEQDNNPPEYEMLEESDADEDPDTYEQIRNMMENPVIAPVQAALKKQFCYSGDCVGGRRSSGMLVTKTAFRRRLGCNQRPSLHITTI